MDTSGPEIFLYKSGITVLWDMNCKIYTKKKVSTICITCQILHGEILPPRDFIYKNDFIVLHHCLDINIAGYFILSPIRHIEGLGELNHEELQHLSEILKVVINTLIKEEDIERVYALSIGEETKHVHMHLFPRYNWMLKICPQYIYTNGKVDGGKLFSYVREKYQVDKQDLFESRLSLLVNAVGRALSAP